MERIMNTNMKACELANRELEDAELDKISAAGFWGEMGSLLLTTGCAFAAPSAAVAEEIRWENNLPR